VYTNERARTGDRGANRATDKPINPIGEQCIAVDERTVIDSSAKSRTNGTNGDIDTDGDIDTNGSTHNRSRRCAGRFAKRRVAVAVTNGQCIERTAAAGGPDSRDARDARLGIADR